jgi:hypothetical protein
LGSDPNKKRQVADGMNRLQKNRFAAVFFEVRFEASLAWAFGSVEPVGQHEQAKNHEHDDEDVFDFHGFSLG